VIGAALLAATAAAAPYPVQDILSAFGDVCLDPGSYWEKYTELTPTQKANAWKGLAVKKGWTEVAASDDSAARTYYWAKALDYELFVPLMQYGTGRITVQALFAKRVAGRKVFLSVFGADVDNPTIAECRLRDPLGDGVAKSPVAKADIERWLGHKVKRGSAPYRGTRYSWPGKPSERAIQYHFGFKAKPFATYGAKYDPYSLYGMTLVRSDFSQDIII
jgi:hypothetical protein